ncbi:unnamed protein product [Caenorhabditis brenneri]
MWPTSSWKPLWSAELPSLRICEIGSCKIYENGRYYCKSCRLKKCFEKGMETKKFQNSRDPISSTRTRPPSLASFLGRPEFILACEPDKVCNIKTVIDVSYLIDKAMKILDQKQDFPTPYIFENSLERITLAMERRRQPKRKLRNITKVGKLEAMLFWEQSFVAAAEWFAGFSEFVELEMNVKIEILTSSWLLFGCLERLAKSAEFCKSQLLGYNEFVCSDGATVIFDKVKVDWSWCTNYSMEQLRGFLTPNIEKHWRTPVETLMKLEPSNIELNFMLLQLCLHEAGKRNQGKVLEATDHLLQIQADNLHDYYTKQLKMPYYSGRLAKLMKVNQAIQADVRERKERSLIGKLFNLFTVEYSHPEMFEFS